jgi:hypothetical protein
MGGRGPGWGPCALTRDSPGKGIGARLRYGQDKGRWAMGGFSPLVLGAPL